MTAFTCTACKDGRGYPVRLEVTRVSHPAPGVTVRQRRCPQCERATTTEERERGALGVNQQLINAIMDRPTRAART
ncbi:hypothetical protein [Gemmata sp.]|uniref:hypothetical protein n=1 Tax=Gemmata sp. TaxID=1914242 RepID=UPI003F71AC58